MKQAMLTTVDNPFDPFDQFDSWFNYDMDKGYNTCAYLARVAFTSDSLSDVEYAKELERAMDSIIEFDPYTAYKKVYREIEDE